MYGMVGGTQAEKKAQGPAPKMHTQHRARQQDSMESSHMWKWSVPGWYTGHVTNTSVFSQHGGEKKEGEGGQKGAERWQRSRSYLSIQKICWRWGSDRCPFHTLPHAAWIWKEQEGRKGHWAVAQDNLTYTVVLTHTVQYIPVLL